MANKRIKRRIEKKRMDFNLVFKTPDGKEESCACFIENLPCEPDGPVDLNDIPRFESLDGKGLSASFETPIDEKALRKAFPQIGVMEELFDMIRSKSSKETSNG